jgi:hypothetical protein
MTTHPTRSRVKAAALALCGIVAITTAACAALSPAAAARPSRPPAVTVAATTAVPVLVNCAMKAQTRPGQYVLACGDGNFYLDRLNWAAWGSSSAFAEGINTFNDCVPFCAGGHFHSFPVLAALWRAEPRPGHAGQRYFTRLTLIYTGSRTYSAGGKRHQLPATATYPLSALGGGG